MKPLAKKAVAAVLGTQIRRLYKKNDFKVIAVVGGIGKTSTKLAIASILKAGFKVQHQEGNYNDIVTVPLVFFGEQTPSLFSPMAWAAVFWRNEKQLRKKYPFDLVVLELGTDGPGQIKAFKDYLKLEIAIVTSIVPEHMEFFGNLDNVAKEELAVGEMASLIMANKDFCDDKYLAGLPELLTYAIEKPADYKLASDNKQLTINSGEITLIETENGNLTTPEMYSLLAAVAVAYKMGMEPEDIKSGIKNIKPVPGRMQRLAGIKDSTIIDDSYNASPEAVKLALQSLYQMDAPQKIALLGNMNELGDHSKDAHTEIGGLCDPKQLDLVVTLGPDANKYLAPAAEAMGCNVKSFDSPYVAGEYIKEQVKEGALILVKGSQNFVFAEEAIKSLLANPNDESNLVRQTPAWLQKKKKAFGR